jgi:hypothetical protein
VTRGRALRWIVALVAGVSALSLAESVLHARRTAGSAAGLATTLATPAPVVVLAAVALASLFLFARREAAPWPAVPALVAMAILEHTLARLSPAGHHHSFFASGAVLAGWAAGLAFARWRGRPVEEHERVAEAAGAAALAATYVDAGLSKLVHAGALWLDAATLRSALVSNMAVDDASPLASYARFVVDHDGFARALSAGTLAIQLGAVLFLVGPRARMLWGALLLAFHVNVGLLTGFEYKQAAVLLVAFAFPWERLAAWRRR